ncbi:MAG: hypothetical protein ABIR15_17095 [Chitinophagaceae bacterium]
MRRALNFHGIIVVSLTCTVKQNGAEKKNSDGSNTLKDLADVEMLEKILKKRKNK